MYVLLLLLYDDVVWCRRYCNHYVTVCVGVCMCVGVYISTM